MVKHFPNDHFSKALQAESLDNPDLIPLQPNPCQQGNFIAQLEHKSDFDIRLVLRYVAGTKILAKTDFADLCHSMGQSMKLDKASHEQDYIRYGYALCSLINQELVPDYIEMLVIQEENKGKRSIIAYFQDYLPNFNNPILLNRLNHLPIL